MRASVVDVFELYDSSGGVCRVLSCYQACAPNTFSPCKPVSDPDLACHMTPSSGGQWLVLASLDCKHGLSMPTKPRCPILPSPGSQFCKLRNLNRAACGPKPRGRICHHALRLPPSPYLCRSERVRRNPFLQGSFARSAVYGVAYP